MPWWLWVIIVLALLIALLLWFFYRATKNPSGYLSRSQTRLWLAGKLVDEVQDSLVNKGVLPKDVMRTEGKLYTLVEAQKNERLPHPAMEEHRDAYAQLIEFQWQKVQDLRVTGGQNLEDIVAAEEEFGMQGETKAKQRAEEHDELRRSMGMSPMVAPLIVVTRAVAGLVPSQRRPLLLERPVDEPGNANQRCPPLVSIDLDQGHMMGIRRA